MIWTIDPSARSGLRPVTERDLVRELAVLRGRLRDSQARVTDLESLLDGSDLILGRLEHVNALRARAERASAAASLWERRARWRERQTWGVLLLNLGITVLLVGAALWRWLR